MTESPKNGPDLELLTKAQLAGLDKLRKAADAYIAAYKPLRDIPRPYIAPINVPFRKRVSEILTAHNVHLATLAKVRRDDARTARADAAKKTAAPKADAAPAKPKVLKKALKKTAKKVLKKKAKPESLPASVDAAAREVVPF